MTPFTVRVAEHWDKLCREALGLLSFVKALSNLI